MWNNVSFILCANVVCNELAHIQRPPEVPCSLPSAYTTQASHPTLRRALLAKWLDQRRSCRASSHKPSRPMRIRCISVLHPEGIIKSSTGGRADFHQPPLLHGLRTALMDRSPHPERQHRPGDRLRQVGGTAGHTRCTRWEFHHSRAHLSLLRNGERRNPSWRGPGGHVLAPAVKRRSGVLCVRCRSPPPFPPRLRMPARWENRR